MLTLGLDDLGVSRGSFWWGNFGGNLTELRNSLASLHDDGLYIVVGVFVLFLHTTQAPLREALVERAGFLLVSREEVFSSDAAPVTTTETVISLGLSGVAGVVGES